MSVAKLYKATLPSINYVFKNGKPAIFVRGRFSTSIASEISELDNEIALGHPHIYIDTEEETTAEATSNEMLAGLRAQWEAEFRAKMEAASSVANDRGNSEVTKLTPSSSVDIAAAAIGNGAVSEAVAAKLVNLKAGK